MSYKRKPAYHFATKNETGINKVPQGRLVVVEDYDGAAKLFLLETKTGLADTTTIATALANNNIVADKTDITVDTTPINGSTNPITSNAVYDGLAGKLNSGATAAKATKLATPRTIDITGDITATAVSFDGTSNIAISATVNDDSHNHTIANVDGLQTALNNATTPNASTAVAGKVERATDAEASAGTDTTRYISPKQLKTATNAVTIPNASTTVAGKVERATDAEAAAGTDTVRYVTPAQLHQESNGFKSALQTPWAANNAGIEVAHGLGYTPTDIGAYYQCTIADGGYQVGDIIRVGTGMNSSSSDRYTLYADNNIVGLNAVQVYGPGQVSTKGETSVGAYGIDRTKFKLFFTAK